MEERRKRKRIEENLHQDAQVAEEEKVKRLKMSKEKLLKEVEKSLVIDVQNIVVPQQCAEPQENDDEQEEEEGNCCWERMLGISCCIPGGLLWWWCVCVCAGEWLLLFLRVGSVLGMEMRLKGLGEWYGEGRSVQGRWWRRKREKGVHWSWECVDRKDGVLDVGRV
jgi:hypothetical protein